MSEIAKLEQRMDKRFDDLTALMNTIASEVQRRFDQQGVRFDRIEDRFDKLDARHDRLINIIDGLITRIDDREAKLVTRDAARLNELR